MNRSVLLGLAGGAGAFVAWLVSEPFAHTAAVDGIRAGSIQFSLGSFYGWFAHALLGGLIVGAISFTINVGRNRLPRAFAFGLMGLALGALLGWLSDATSDRLMIASIRAGHMPYIGSTLFWNLAITLALALAIFLSCSPTLPRLARMSLGGLAAGILGFVTRMVLEVFTAIFTIVRTSGQVEYWQPFSVSRLGDDLIMGFVLGAAIGIADSLMSSGKLRLILGRNEGRDFLLGAGVNRIGCAEGIEVPIFDRGIAPVQAQVFRHGPQFVLQVLAGPAAVFLNGAPVQTAPLNHGDTIRIGSNNLLFTVGGAPVVATPMYSMPPMPVSAPAHESAAPVALRHTLKDSFGTTMELQQGVNAMGRDAGLAVSLPYESSVSRRHAQVTVQGSQAVLSDLGSTNGTFVNGERLTADRSLTSGDVVQLGRAELVYKAGG